MKKKIIFIVLIIVIGGGLFLILRGKNGNLTLRGEVEGTVYSQIAEVAGKITEMNLELGGKVNAGDLIARIDNTDQKYALEQMEIVLEKKKLTLVSLLKGVRREEMEKALSDVHIAEANFRSAEATYSQAHGNRERLLLLFEAGGLAQNEMDKATLQETIAAEALEAAKGQTEKAREQFSLLQKGADTETLAMAEVDIKETESKIRQMRETLNKYDIFANCGGIVISKNYNPGSMVNAGYNLADISSDNDKYVVCYIPREISTRISYGQVLKIRHNGKEYRGEVRFIDVKSQYTPKDMQTSSAKNKVSVKVKLLLPAGQTPGPGSRVDVSIDKKNIH